MIVNTVNNTYQTTLVLSKNSWNTLVISLENDILQISLNNSSSYTCPLSINLEDKLWYLGNKENGMSEALNGYIEMFAFKKDGIATSRVAEIHTKGEGLLYREVMDDEMRVKDKSFHIQDSSSNYSNMIYNTHYTYDNLRISSESDSINSSNNISKSEYAYDAKGNITERRNFQGDNLVKKINYTYDKLNRLTCESIKDGSTTHYTYDLNGNIMSLVETASDGTIINNRTYYYSNTYKDRLDRISDNILHQNITTISYDFNKTFYPSSYTKNGVNQNLVWKGNCLMGIGGISFTYNSDGIRTSKIKTGETVTYQLENSRIISVTFHQTYDDITLHFIYNGSGLLIGLETSDGSYYYKRDITGIIEGIIDKNGNYVIKYTYDAWGKVLDRDIITMNFASLYNPILYKGYYYDEETGLFWCNSRYYNPEWGRFISPDSVDYLDPESINGLNLYAYCGNDPVQGYDPSGHMPEWLKWTISAVTLAGLGVATTVTGGATAPLLLGAIGGAVSGLIGGITFDENGIGYDWNKASTGVMLGAFVGAISGGIGSGLSSIPVFADSSLAYRGIMAGVDGLLGLGNYFAQNGINGTMNQISVGGALISFGSGLFDFCNPTSKIFDALWTPTIGAEIG